MGLVYINGTFVPREQAAISIFDRGFLFGHSIYEVVAVIEGQLVDFELHYTRMERSMSEIGLVNQWTPEDLSAIFSRLIMENALGEGIIYVQVTAGIEEERNFVRLHDTKPSIVIFTQSKSIAESRIALEGARVVLCDDLRWQRRDIKSTNLLAAVLSKSRAVSKGADEVWMTEEGFITEGGSSTAFIANARSEIVTRDNSTRTLPGCTKQSLLSLFNQYGKKIVYRPIHIDEAKEASEAFFTSASSFVVPVIEIDSQKIGDGKPGPLTRELQKIYLKHLR